MAPLALSSVACTGGIAAFYAVMYTGYDKMQKRWRAERIGDLLPWAPFSVPAWNKLSGLCTLTTLGLTATRALALAPVERAIVLPSTSTLLKHSAAWAVLHTTLTLVGKYRLDPQKVFLWIQPPGKRLSLFLGYAAMGIVTRGALHLVVPNAISPGWTAHHPEPTVTLLTLLGLLHFVLMEGGADAQGMQVRPAAHLATAAAALPLGAALARLVMS